MLRHSVGGGFFCYPYFVSDPLLQSLRPEPEFKDLMKQALDRHDQFKATFFLGAIQLFGAQVTRVSMA
jgi:hypothetical protein